MTLQIKDITKQVGTETHLEAINLTLDNGSFNVILGPTLSGKTTLLRLLAGLDRSSSGQLLMNGQDLSTIPVWRRKVAMVYQQFINYPHLNIYDNIAFPLKRMKLSAEKIDKKVKAVAELLQIEAYLHRKPSELSGGQQQRTALARSLVKEADLLLMDEPLINLDYKLREQIRDEFKNIFKTNSESIIIYSTTDPLEALQLGGNIIILNEGRQLQAGPTHYCFRHPQTEEVAKVFNDPPMNMVDGKISNGQALLGEVLKIPRTSHIKNLPDGSYRFGLRASDLFLKKQGSNDNVLSATIELGEISGSETFIHARHNNVSWVIHEPGIHDHTLGEKIHAYFNASNLFVFTSEGRLVSGPETTTSLQ
jgi:glycerol transport system ATP-binding protein